MKTSITFLKSIDSFSNTINKINETDASMIHIDVMDGLFVKSVTPFDKEKLEILKNKKKLEVHLMTLHLKKFIDVFSSLNPEYITFQFEATCDVLEYINYIKGKNIKVGIAISPLTNLEELKPFLSLIDLVIVMGVIPGYGGQKFIKTTTDRVDELYNYRKSNKLKYLISVDGGINDKTAIKVKEAGADVLVAGSYIFKNDIKKAVKSLE